MQRGIVNPSLGNRLANVDIFQALTGASLFCFIGSIFFSSLIPGTGAVRLGSVVVILLSSLAPLLRSSYKVKILPAGALLICFLVFIVFNRGSSLIFGSDRMWFLFFTSCVLMAFLLAGNLAHWIEFSAKLIAVFALVHAVATVVFFIVPNLYWSWFKPHYFPSTATANGYKAGLSSHYSTNGMYLAWGLIAAFYYWQVDGRRRSRKWEIAAILLFVAILLTTKRAHLVFGIAACFVIYLLLNSGKGTFGTVFKVTSFVVCALVALYVASQFVPELAAVVSRLQDAEVDEGRSSYYGVCFDMFVSSPFIGESWGSFTTALFQSGVSDLARLYRQGFLNQNAHSVYLQVLAEEGICGFLLFLGFAISALVYSIKSALTPSGDQSYKLFALSAGVQVFFLLYCVTGNPLYELIEYSVYLLVGIAPCLTRVLPASRTRRQLREHQSLEVPLAEA